MTAEETAEWVQSKVPTAVSWDGWQRIDMHETGLGEPQGRPRVKLVRVGEMHEIARRIEATR